MYVLQKMFNIGFLPKAIVSDQGTNNQGAIKLLGSTSERPYLYLNNKKIYTIFDVPHLFKSLRNNMLSGDFILLDKKISFKDVVDTYNIDKGSTTARALTKITDFQSPQTLFKKCLAN